MKLLGKSRRSVPHEGKKKVWKAHRTRDCIGAEEREKGMVRKPEAKQGTLKVVGRRWGTAARTGGVKGLNIRNAPIALGKKKKLTDGTGG